MKKQTTKKFRKGISLFLAVMMLLSAWVFVEPEKAQVSASGTDNAAAVSAANLAELNTITGLNTDVTTVYGSFPDDGNNSDYNTEVNRNNTYKNILYIGNTNKNLDNSMTGSYKWNVVLSKNNNPMVGLAFFYPTVTFMYDGVTAPRTGIALYVDRYNYNIRTHSGYMTNESATGLDFVDNYWQGPDSTAINFYWNYYSHTGSNKASTDGTVNGSNYYNKDDDYNLVNILTYKGSMADNEFYKVLTPNFAWKGNFNSEGNNADTVTGFTNTSTIAVINYKPLKARLDEAITVVNNLKNEPAMYSTASVKDYVAAVKALIAAKPNNYVSATKNNPSGYATAAEKAINQYDTAVANAKLATYTLTFQKYDGTIAYTNTLDYGTPINCNDLAPANSITQIANNDSYHQAYVWDANNMGITTLVDDVTIKEVADRTVAHSFGDKCDNITDTNHSWTCSVCGYVKTQAHVKDSGTITKTETCTEDGIRTYNCSVCGKEAIATDPINNINGHDFTTTPVENVTGQDGNHWRKCSRCDVYGWGGVENACENHNWDKNGNGVVDASDAETKASTCKEAGYEKYTCKVCNATWTKTLELAAHITTKTPAKDVTNVCGAEGNVEFWSCSVCGRVWTDVTLTVEADATDADNDGIPDVLETKGPEHEFTGAYVSVSVGKNGKHHRQCKNFTQCNTYGPEEPHNWGTPAVVDATCTKEGSKTYTCTDCSQTYTETIEKAPHQMTKIEAVAAECGKAGNNEYYQCDVCKNYYKDEAGTTATTVAAETIKALTHTWTVHHDYDTLKTAATCQSPAVYNNHCDYCKVQLAGATHEYGEVDKVNGHKFNGELQKNDNGTHSYKCTVAGCTEYGNATNCNYEITKDVASTCKTQGYTTYECKDCHNGYSDMKDLDPDNHEGGTEVKDKIDATCSTDGYTGDTYCLGCETKLEDGETITAGPSYPHENMKDYEKLDSTCQTEGYKAYRYCDKCDTYEIAKETIAVKAHNFTNYTSNGDGTHTATCDTCDEAVATPVTDKKDCSGGTANCVEAAVCTVCNTAYGNVNSENHKTVVTVPTKDSTCQTDGYEAYRHCNACNTDIEVKVAIEKKEHKYGAWTQVVGEDKHTRTCTTCVDDAENGLIVATETAACSGGTANCLEKAVCKDCKTAYGDVDKTNHKNNSVTTINKKDATCTEKGYTGDKIYDCCKAVKEKGTDIDMLPHSFTVEVAGSREDATCIAEGKVTYKCANCNAPDERVLPINSKNHASNATVTVGYKEGSCTEDGYTGDKYHACCYDKDATDEANKKALISKGEVVKGNGAHDYGVAVPEYMVQLSEDERFSGSPMITRDENGDYQLLLVAGDVDYDAKVAARHEDGKWYHIKLCKACGEAEFGACYTYEHTYNCVETDICEVCSGLCSLTSDKKHDNMVLVEGKPATCIATGIKDYYECEDCGKAYLDNAGKTAVDTTDANNDGVYDALVTDKIAHSIDWSNGETANGVTTYKCKTEGCDYAVTVGNTDSSCKHIWSNEDDNPDNDYIVVKEPTCYKTGYKAICCTLCGAVKSGSSLVIGMLEHDYDDGKVTTEPTCTVDGVKTYTCQVEKCGHTYTEVITAKGHDWDEGTVNSVANCAQAGETVYTCKTCGETNTVTVPKTGEHQKSDEGKVIKEATCSESGYMQYVCKVCLQSFIETIPPTEKHVGVVVPGVDPTCTTTGCSESVICGECGAVIDEGEEIPADPDSHYDHDGDGYCDGCKYDLLEGSCDCICHKNNFFMKFIYKILRFFWKLFGIGKSCRCGYVHY